RKAYALLVYLAVHEGKDMRRDVLANLLWHNVSDARARHSLSQALYELRSAACNFRIEALGEVIRLQAGSVFVDSNNFERYVALGHLADAASVYTGPFLDGFWVRGAPAFEQWQDRHR